MFYLVVNRMLKTKLQDVFTETHYESEKHLLDEYDCDSVKQVLEKIRNTCEDYFAKAYFAKVDDDDYYHQITATPKQLKELREYKKREYAKRMNKGV